MNYFSRLHWTLLSVMISLLLSACGGGAVDTKPADNTPSTETGAPLASGDYASDGFNWFNFRRKQMGLPLLMRSKVIDAAAQNHSLYQKLNNGISHDEFNGKPGYTGTGLFNRLNYVGYSFSMQDAYAYGEVIAASTRSSGFSAGEELIAAIFHRFLIFEPSYKEAGAGAASSGAYTYFTTDFAANNGLGNGIGKGKLASYPFANQTQVPTIFYSDEEIPDPVPNQNAVGYPISVHADTTSTVLVRTFSVQVRGGLPLAVKVFSSINSSETPHSAAAIIPLTTLTPNTLYDVQFDGSVDGVPLVLNWSFTTK